MVMRLAFSGFRFKGVHDQYLRKIAKNGAVNFFLAWHGALPGQF